MLPPLAISLTGLEPGPHRPWGDGPLAMLEWAAELGYCHVQLNAAAQGTRARDLDRSARRDLAGAMRRRNLSLAGLDLWIPPQHFADPARADRALSATLGAIELVADLAQLLGTPHRVLSLVLPDPCPDEALSAIEAKAETCSVSVADHAWPVSGAPMAEATPIGVGLDPAAPIVAGEDPAIVAASLGQRLVSARVSDAGSAGGPDGAGRTRPGGPGGRLDLLAYAGTLGAIGYAAPAVLDLRGLGDQADAARAVPERWASLLPM